MRLKVLNSDSSGNCYLFEATDCTLIVECGVNFKIVKQSLNFDLSKVAGCIVTHEHKDHCKALKDVVQAGINVYTSPGTINAFDIKSHKIRPVIPQETYLVGSFNIMPFLVKHDAVEPLGFLIKHDECGTVLFLTDTYLVPYKFAGLNNILIECNYSQEIIDERSYCGELIGLVRKRVETSHLSLATCIEVLRQNNLSQVNNIVLLHLSDGNSNAKQFKEAVQVETGKSVHVADKGLLINLDKEPF